MDPYLFYNYDCEWGAVLNTSHSKWLGWFNSTASVEMNPNPKTLEETCIRSWREPPTYNLTLQKHIIQGIRDTIEPSPPRYKIPVASPRGTVLDNVQKRGTLQRESLCSRQYTRMKSGQRHTKSTILPLWRNQAMQANQPVGGFSEKSEQGGGRSSREQQWRRARGQEWQCEIPACIPAEISVVGVWISYQIPWDNCEEQLVVPTYFVQVRPKGRRAFGIPDFWPKLIGEGVSYSCTHLCEDSPLKGLWDKSDYEQTIYLFAMQTNKSLYATLTGTNSAIVVSWGFPWYWSQFWWFSSLRLVKNEPPQSEEYVVGSSLFVHDGTRNHRYAPEGLFLSKGCLYQSLDMDKGLVYRQPVMKVSG